MTPERVNECEEWPSAESGRPVAVRIEAGRSSRVRQFSSHVAGLIEKMSVSVVPIRAPLTMIRPASKLVYCLVS